eukprot:6196254-Pleurochrysis_carterae.AAC.1
MELSHAQACSSRKHRHAALASTGMQLSHAGMQLSHAEASSLHMRRHARKSFSLHPARPPRPRPRPRLHPVVRRVRQQRVGDVGARRGG